LAGFATTGLMGTGVTGWAAIAAGAGSSVGAGAGSAGTTRVFMAFTEDSLLRLQAEPVSERANQCDSNTAASNDSKVRSRMGKLEKTVALSMLQYTASVLACQTMM
jgi:hypothetical protein